MELHRSALLALRTGSRIRQRSGWSPNRGTVANPPPDINGGIPKTSAGMLVGAMCAKDGTPIVVDGPFPNR
jgi:hypothetical protein